MFVHSRINTRNMESMNPSLNSISPVDGRYHGVTESLSAYFSESAIIRYRILVEVEYFIALCNLPLPQLKGFNKKRFNELRSLYRKFEEADAAKGKAFEKVTNHDVKATEYFLRARFDELGLGSFKEFIHFGLTSQDIHNPAFPLALRDAVEESVPPCLAQS